MLVFSTRNKSSIELTQPIFITFCAKGPLVTSTVLELVSNRYNKLSNMSHKVQIDTNLPPELE